MKRNLEESQLILATLEYLTSALDNISNCNINALLDGSYGSIKYFSELDVLISKLLLSHYFLPSNRDDDLKVQLRFRRSLGMPKDFDIRNFNTRADIEFLSTPCFSPIANEYQFSLRQNLTESTTLEPPLAISTRNYLNNNFEWNLLFSVNDLIALGNESRNKLCASFFKIFKDSLFLSQELKKQQLCTAFFSTLPKTYDHSRWQSCTVGEIVDLVSQTGYSWGDVQRQGFNFVCFKTDKSVRFAQSSTLSPKISSDLYQQSKPKTYVVFIDSLDLTILDEQNAEDIFPNLLHIKQQSLHFSRFTSSGDWTFPCLHSIHTGISPYKSFSMFRHDSSLRLAMSQSHLAEIFANNTQNLAPYAFKLESSNIKFPAISISHNKLYHSSKYFLGNIIASCAYKQIAVKSSPDHGCQYGYNYGIHSSIEASFQNEIIDNLDKLILSVIGSDPNLIFLDIDLLHGNDGYTPNSLRDPANNKVDQHAFDWTKGYASSKENLMSSYNNNDRLKINYLRKMVKVDRYLGQIYSKLSSDDSLLIFSDHGSNYYDFQNGNYTNDVPYDSPAKLKKIWKPTLLIKSPIIPTTLIGGVSDELVETTDLYSIILSLCGINAEDYSHIIDSQLPVSLGGKKSRNIAITASTPYRQQIADDGLLVKQSQVDCQRMDLIVRNSNDTLQFLSSQTMPTFKNFNLNTFLQSNYPEILERLII